MVVWDREDYLKEASKQLEDKDIYEEVQNDPSTLINTNMRTLEKIRMRGDLSNDTLNYFLVKSNILNLVGFTFYLRFTNVCIMFLEDPLFQIVDSIQKISPHFWTIIYNL